ncbi:hypothetical protein DPMN_093592 [Dreissena polymorpha]|uniref:Uncharacterized protein n=1 Tax=Dreissena polymorpha TaxID=45954 RepID=A0A9D4L5T1_DREPO|nr:hypothetical protein DPMN_093567 [Dreissena polymorpha]KAH3851112.1 hypothetical protein DPMN_093592 [Dreissena polymorpha]
MVKRDSPISAEVDARALNQGDLGSVPAPGACELRFWSPRHFGVSPVYTGIHTQ